MPTRRPVSRVLLLKNDLAQQLHRAKQAVDGLYAQELARVGLTHRQFVVLAALDEHDALSQAEVVRHTDGDRSTTSELVSRLVRKGLVEQGPNPADLRANMIRITDQGREVLAEGRRSVASAGARLSARWSAARRKALLSELSALAEAADAAAAPQRSAHRNPAPER